MKLIIDIPEWKYESICEGVEASKRCGVVGIDPDIHEAIYNGIPYEERPHSKWVKIFENPFTNGYVCPFCGHKIQVTEQFLPEVTECEACGSDMRGAENG